jgi:hypothetical protein
MKPTLLINPAVNCSDSVSPTKLDINILKGGIRRTNTKLLSK